MTEPEAPKTDEAGPRRRSSIADPTTGPEDLAKAPIKPTKLKPPIAKTSGAAKTPAKPVNAAEGSPQPALSPPVGVFTPERPKPRVVYPSKAPDQ
jgi:hypothetical protein